MHKNDADDDCVGVHVGLSLRARSSVALFRAYPAPLATPSAFVPMSKRVRILLDAPSGGGGGGGCGGENNNSFWICSNIFRLSSVDPSSWQQTATSTSMLDRQSRLCSPSWALPSPEGELNLVGNHWCSADSTVSLIVSEALCTGTITSTLTHVLPSETFIPESHLGQDERRKTALTGWTGWGRLSMSWVRTATADDFVRPS